VNLTCEYCGKQFTTSRKRRCCDRSCSGKLAQVAKGKLAWQPEELGLIDDLLGSYPIEVIAKRIQALDKKKGWPIRTVLAVEVKAKRLYPSVRPVFNNFSLNEIANILGISRERTRLWTRTHGLPYVRRHTSCLSIKQKDFQDWAYKHPKKLAGIEAERLNYLMDDWDFCEEVEQMPYAGEGIARPVKNLTTGQVFKSVYAAAKASYVVKGCITGAIKRGGKSAGCQWEYVSM
jgi:hypothetical protein